MFYSNIGVPVRKRVEHGSIFRLLQRKPSGLLIELKAIQPDSDILPISSYPSLYPIFTALTDLSTRPPGLLPEVS